jgi:hypothetical protein
MDGLASHLKFMLKNLKFKNKYVTLTWLPDLIHLFAHLAHVLANPDKSLLTARLLGDLLPMRFSGRVADTDWSWLRRFWNKKFLDKTIAAMKHVSMKKREIWG